MRAPTLPALLALLPLLAGCSQAPEAPPAEPAAVVVGGFVLDPARAPVEGAAVTVQGQAANATTDAAGRFSLEAPTGVDLLLTASAAGFVPQSQLVPAFSGARHDLSFTLQRVPFDEPYTAVQDFNGVVSCGVTVVVGEDPSSPHEHRGLRCDDLLPDWNNAWNYTIPHNTTGVVLEGFWEPQSELSKALVVKASIRATGEVLGYVETMSPLRIQLSKVALQQNLAAGHDILAIVVTPGAGTGNHDHGAAGAFVQQRFQLVATAFFNGPVDPAYTVRDG
jgi:hypothetical protein